MLFKNIDSNYERYPIFQKAYAALVDKKYYDESLGQPTLKFGPYPSNSMSESSLIYGYTNYNYFNRHTVLNKDFCDSLDDNQLLTLFKCAIYSQGQIMTGLKQAFKLQNNAAIASIAVMETASVLTSEPLYFKIGLSIAYLATATFIHESKKAIYAKPFITESTHLKQEFTEDMMLDGELEILEAEAEEFLIRIGQSRSEGYGFA